MHNKRIRILFIKPHERKKGPQTLDIPLSFLYLSSYLKAYLDESVEIGLIDLRLKQQPVKDLTRTLQTFEPDIIGISLLSPNKDFLDSCLFVLTDHAPKAQIVIGGPCATYEHNAILTTHQDVDCAVIGEGEKIFLNFVEACIKGYDFKKIKGIAYFNGHKVVVNETEDYIADLDTIPFPDYSLINPAHYCGLFQTTMNVVLAERRYVHIMSSRGCPFQCCYCHNMFGKTLRKRSPENFVSEIRWLYDEFGIREFDIVDDIFNLDRTRMHVILNLIVDSGMRIKIAFPNGLRGDLLEEEDIRLLKQAGTYMITFAIETASPRLQKIIRKNLNIKKVIHNIDYASSLGLLTKGFFMLGFPGETVDEIKETTSLAIKSRLDFAAFFIVVPFPQTGLALLASQAYPELYQAEHAFHVDFYGEKSFYFEATGYNVKRMQRLAYFRFYFPFRWGRTIIKIPRKSCLLSLPYALLQMFFPRSFFKR